MTSFILKSRPSFRKTLKFGRTNTAIENGYSDMTPITENANEEIAVQLVKCLRRMKFDPSEEIILLDLGTADGIYAESIVLALYKFASENSIKAIRFIGMSLEPYDHFKLAEHFVKKYLPEESKENTRLIQDILGNFLSPIRKHGLESHASSSDIRNALDRIHSELGYVIITFEFLDKTSFYEESSWIGLNPHIITSATADHWITERTESIVVPGFFQANLCQNDIQKAKIIQEWETDQKKLLTNILKALRPVGFYINGGLIELNKRFPADIGYQLLSKSFGKILRANAAMVNIDFKSLFPEPKAREKLAEKVGFLTVFSKETVIPCVVSSKLKMDPTNGKLDINTRNQLARSLRKTVESWSRWKLMVLSDAKIDAIFEMLEVEFFQYLDDHPIPPEGILPYQYEFLVLRKPSEREY